MPKGVRFGKSLNSSRTCRPKSLPSFWILWSSRAVASKAVGAGAADDIALADRLEDAHQRAPLRDRATACARGLAAARFVSRSVTRLCACLSANFNCGRSPRAAGRACDGAHGAPYAARDRPQESRGTNL